MQENLRWVPPDATQEAVTLIALLAEDYYTTGEPINDVSKAV